MTTTKPEEHHEWEKEIVTVGWGNQYGGQVAMQSQTDMLAKGTWLGVSFSEQIMTIGFSGRQYKLGMVMHTLNPSS